jgi:ribosome recycling factor
MDPVLAEVNQKFQNSLDHLKHELSAIRAGRANPAIVEDLMVEAYGSKMKMMELGTISTPQPTLLTIQLWDASIIRNVEKAITESSLGINPAVDGTLIRLPIPPLTAERREEFVKVAHQKGEDTKVSIRQARQEQKEAWSKQKEAGDISEDDLFRYEKLLQDQVDKANATVDSLVKDKQADLREI